ncbi:MAG: 2,3-bisphosphoglycerate-independent phosphoglycerate mutase, partial [Coprobacillus sp.]
MKKRPIVLCILDGYGLTERIDGNAVKLANTPNLDDLMAMYPTTTIQASGIAVGLP